MALISKKKIVYPIREGLRNYLVKYGREVDIPIHYRELLRFSNSIALYDFKGNDTLWETVFYDEADREEIHYNIKKIYAILKADGDMSVMEHLYVDRVDLCTYGNTQPFRIRIVNKINDNFDYFYIKYADASRVYGLELEHLLSPNRISYLVYKDSLIEEHIAGIPGEQFMKMQIHNPLMNPIRLSKEFVKFNERCFVRLLGDMHSSNFVIEVTPDFEDTHFRIRAIDFDQQCYEGRMKVYLPQFFKENYDFVDMAMKLLGEDSVTQYQNEERSLMRRRVGASRYQLQRLIKTMRKDTITDANRLGILKRELAEYHKNKSFLRLTSMGAVLYKHINICLELNLSPPK